MNKGFEHKISELIKPLIDHQVVLHYPLFANTFPLAYYYIKYLKQAEINVDEFVIQKDWNDKTVPKLSKEKPLHLTFDTVREFPKGKFGDKIAFTTYYPKYIFTDLSSEIVNFLNDEKLFLSYIDKKRDFSRKEIDDDTSMINLDLALFRKLVNFLGISCIQIFTDTFNEAEQLKTIINKSGNFPGMEVSIIEATKDWQSKFRISEHVLNFYFFSAPFNVLFLKHHSKYIPFKIDSWTISKFETYNYLIHQKNSAQKKLNKIKWAIEEFHKLIFYQASHCPENLLEVSNSYNDVIKINDPLKVFDDVYAYAKCICLHAPRIKSNPESGEMTTIWLEIINPDISERYNTQLQNVYHDSVDKSNIIVLYHLIKHHSFSMHNYQINYPTIRKIIFNDDLSEGYYAPILKDYIRLKIFNLIQEFKQEEDHCINRALKIGIKEDAILDILVMRTEKVILKDNSEDSIKRLFDINDRRFGILREFEELRCCCPLIHDLSNIKYIQTSLEIIYEFYNVLLNSIANIKQKDRITFIGDALTRMDSFETVLANRSYQALTG